MQFKNLYDTNNALHEASVNLYLILGIMKEAAKQFSQGT